MLRNNYHIDILTHQFRHFKLDLFGVSETHTPRSKYLSLSQFKMKPMVYPKPLLRPYMGLCCQTCQSDGKGLFMDETTLQLGLTDILQVRTQFGPFWKRTFCHLLWVASLQPVTQYPNVVTQVMSDTRVESAVEGAAQLSLQKTENGPNIPDEGAYKSFLDSSRRRIMGILHKMAGTVSGPVIRFVSYALHKTLRHLVSSVRVHKGQIEVLKRAEATGKPIIYLPLHKSHLDYILLTFVLYDHNIRVPLIAAGDNLRLPIVGRFAQHLGAFFIRRRLDSHQGEKDLIYRAVLHSYLAQSLHASHSVEIFIEGGRSRSGKPSIPKAGLLGVIYDAYTSGDIQDALIVPVAISYDRIPDGSFVTEELGKPKKPETLWSVFKAGWRLLTGSGILKGAVRLDFCQPFSLADYVVSYKSNISKIRISPIFGPLEPLSPLQEAVEFPHNISTPSVTSYASDSEERRLVDSLARHVIHSASNSLAVTCTGLLSYLLLTKFRNGAPLQRIVEEFEQLRNDVVSKKMDLAFRGDSHDAISYAVELLDSSVKMEVNSQTKEQVLLPITSVPNVLDLSYHANTVIQAFLTDSILSLALLSNLSPVDFTVPKFEVVRSRDAIMNSALQLCDILRYEFIVTPPCQDNETSLLRLLEDFKSKGIISDPINENLGLSETDKWAKRISKHLDWIEEEHENDIGQMEFEDMKFVVNVSKECKDSLRDQASILFPIINSYCYVTKAVESVALEPIEEKKLLRLLQQGVEAECKSGINKFSESIGLDSIKNCLRLLLDWKALELSNHGYLRFYQFNQEFYQGLDYTLILDRVFQFKTLYQ
ncbi:glycerol-3-phosphate acyltransferase 1, mitochondrial-like [Artemia franciscana]|uniref:glycerol-3-phosphate acyltransferase 1, mitochondrial-like n=1 Tax=Artemia franciscana TaxID=6661 RepID=UPI0032DA9D0D